MPFERVLSSVRELEALFFHKPTSLAFSHLVPLPVVERSCPLVPPLLLLSFSVPVMRALPFTVRVSAGLVVPIPNLPVSVITSSLPAGRVEVPFERVLSSARELEALFSHSPESGAFSHLVPVPVVERSCPLVPTFPLLSFSVPVMRALPFTVRVSAGLVVPIPICPCGVATKVVPDVFVPPSILLYLKISKLCLKLSIPINQPLCPVLLKPNQVSFVSFILSKNTRAPLSVDRKIAVFIPVFST